MSEDTSFLSTDYPSVDMLRRKAKCRIPGFAFDYMDGGCNNEIGLRRNTDDIRKLQLIPYYLRDYSEISMKTTLFGETYDAPFGVAPVGLQGLMWPGSTEIIAKAAHDHNILFVLSTVTTASIEEVAKLTEGRAWFQLYHPVEESITDDLLKRCEDVGFKTLVVLSDVPTFAYRPKEIRNGLALPPRMTFQNICQMMASPAWLMATLVKGTPKFKSLTKYMKGAMDLHHLGLFMNQTFNGRLSEDRIKRLRDKWKGNIVVKGCCTVEDTQMLLKVGYNGVIISNHGGRQLDQSPSTISFTKELVDNFKGKLSIMLDSGIREGSDIACAMATGLDFTFLGRTFMYSVCALGERGGNHAMNMLKKQLQQVMEQVCCQKVEDLSKHLANPECLDAC